MKPIAFIDVDGVLNRLCSNSQSKKRRLLRTHGEVLGYRYTLHLDKDDTRRLKSLEPTFELAWGTTWELSADEQIGRQIGLPPISLVARTAANEVGKGPGVVRAAAGRPFVWFEDQPIYQSLLRAPQPHKLILVDPVQGLTDENIEEAKEWWYEVSQDYDSNDPGPVTDSVQGAEYPFQRR